jgi:predicted Zn-dependent protease
MRRLYNGIFGFIIVLLIAAPAGFAAQQQPQAQPQQQPATVDAGQQPQTQDQTATSDEDETVKGVKPGSEKDVNSVGNRGVGKGINLYSLQREIAMGKQAAMEVEKTAKMINDPVVTEYVNRVGQNLVRNSDAKVPFTFQVVEDDVPNAFALPGGFIFVNTGLIKLASEEDELAGAMAHEIAHVAARHLTCQATKGQIAGIASIPAGILLGGGLGGYAARQAMGVGEKTAFLRLSRAAETEADYLGTQYMYAAGYDPTGAISIFEKIESLQKRQPGVFARVFSTHPMDADRIDKTEKEIQQILPAKAQYIVTTSEYRDMRERLIAQDASRKGEAQDGRPRLKVGTNKSDPQDGTTDERPTIRRRDLTQ